MEGHRLVDRLGQFQPPFIDQLENEFGNVHDIEVHIELGVLVLETVVTVRRGNQDRLDAVIDEVPDVAPRQALEQRLVAGLADAFAAAAFILA